MSLSIRTTASLARSVGIAALLSAPLMAAPLSVFAAEPGATGAASSMPPKSTAANAETKAQGVEQQITRLHSELKITSDQESKWNSVAQAMRDNAANMQKLIGEKQQQTASNATAVDVLEANQQFVQAHLDGLKNFTSAFKSLYDSMSDQQKKSADQMFARMNRAPANGAANRNG
ncbi:MAG: Spy/CpxP family protein refolding chaperone [Stellaceae bacterium]